MPTLIMTKGLPGSGKTTWAKEQAQHDSGVIRINKDDLRAMLFSGIWSKQRENFVLRVRDFAVAEGLADGRSVIVDDTNFEPKHETRLRQLAVENRAEFEIKDFTEVPLSVCLERDAARPKPVGGKVIRQMYWNYVHKAPAPPAWDRALPNAIICDLDGTIANMNGRDPYSLDVGDDLVRREVLRVVLDLHHARWATILFVSGRREAAREATHDWLRNKAGLGPGYALFMRADDDSSRDSIVKREIYDREIAGKYNVIAVFDDRPMVLNECWRPLGLPTFDVGPGIDF